MRHRDVHMCAIGAFAMYLWYRLDILGEWSENRPNVGENKDWFFIKLLVSSVASLMRICLSVPVRRCESDCQRCRLITISLKTPFLEYRRTGKYSEIASNNGGLPSGERIINKSTIAKRLTPAS